jgi:NADH-quinone oxidoreductase subunit M
VLWTYQRVFTGPVREDLAEVKDIGARERWVVGPLIAIMLVLGFYPAPALRLVDEPASTTVTQVGVEDAPAIVPVAGDAGTDEGSDK